MTTRTHEPLQAPLRDTSFGFWALRIILSVAFFTSGLMNVIGLAKIGGAFASVGPPDAPLVVLGIVQLVGAVLLVVPGGALLGAGLLGVAMFVALVVRHLAGSTYMEAYTAFWLVLLALVAREAWAPHPYQPGRPFFWQIPARELPQRDTPPTEPLPPVAPPP